MWYKHDKYLLELSGGKAKFYNNNKVAFIGNDYTGIRMFIEASDNDPIIKKKFKNQLEKRQFLNSKIGGGFRSEIERVKVD